MAITRRTGGLDTEMTKYLKSLIFGLLALFIAAGATAQDLPKDPHQSKTFLFVKPLDRISPALFLDGDAVTELENMRRPAPGVPRGWERRSGQTPYNSTAIAAAEVKGLAQYVNVEHDIDAFFAQCDAKLWTGTTSPPGNVPNADSFGNPAYTFDTGASPFFAESFGDEIVFAAKGTTPFAWSGGTTYPDRVFVKQDSGNTLYVDRTNQVTDKRADTYSPWLTTVHTGASNYAFIGFRRPVTGFQLEFVPGAVNAVASANSVWQRSNNGEWGHVGTISDGTASGGAANAVNGHITFDSATTEVPYLLPGTREHLYWYRIGVTVDQTAGVKVARIIVNDICTEITNLWSGLFQITVGTALSSVTGYTDYTGEVTDGTDVEYVDLSGLATTNRLYVGFLQPAFGIFLNITSDSGNQGTPLNANVEYWNGSDADWAFVSGATHDGTAASLGGANIALHHAGVLQWEGQNIDEDKTTLPGFLTALYWYRLSWNATVPSSVYVYEVAQCEKPDIIPPFYEYEGVVEHANRAMWWGGPDKKRMYFSQENKSYVHNGPKAGRTPRIFGPGDINVAQRLSSYLLVSTKNPYRLYLMQGKIPSKFDELLIADHVGVVAPHTLKAINDGVGMFFQDKKISAAVFMGPDGFYMCNGPTPIKIAGEMGDYFDTGSTPYIEPAYMHLSYSWLNYRTKTYHTAVPLNVQNSNTVQTTLNYELVWCWASNESYDRYKRNSPARCGLDVFGYNNQRMPYIGDYNGKVHRADYGGTDNNNIITHHLKTGQFSLGEHFNYVWHPFEIYLKAKAQTVGDIEILLYPDGADSGVTPGGINTISLINSGRGYASGSISGVSDVEQLGLRLRSGVSDSELGVNMQVYGYTVEGYPLYETP